MDEDVRLTGKSGVLASLTHWAFGQLARVVEAPAEYLRRLPATLAVQNLNHGLKAKASPNQASLMFHSNGGLLLRSITSDVYTRIWNHEIVKRMIPLQEGGWKVPPARPVKNDPRARPATEADVMDIGMGGLSVKVGDMIAPAGLYASDHDMFGFMVNEAYRINDGTSEGLSRGFFVENSEVGASAFKMTQFLYRHVCGNHIVWGAKNVREISIRHIGSANEKAWYKLGIELKRYAQSSASDIEAKIASARTYEIAKTKEEVLDKLFNMKITSRKNLELAYDETETHGNGDGNPNTVWGMTQGLTRVSQLSQYADERTELDRSAGKVFEIVF